VTDPAANSIVLSHLGSSVLVVGAIQWLKKAKWVQQATKLICRFASIVAAFAIHVGISWAWNPPGTPVGTLIISGLSLSAILVASYHIAAQFIYQETGYQVLQGLQAMQTLAKAAPKG
jgi:hypothetical protein